MKEKIKQDRSLLGNWSKSTVKKDVGVVVNRYGDDLVVRYLDEKETIKIASEKDITPLTRANVQGKSCHWDAESSDLMKSNP